MSVRAVLVVVVLMVAACGDAGGDGGGSIPIGPGTTSPASIPPPSTTRPSAPLAGLDAELVASAVGQVLAMAAAPDDERLFLAEKEGVIRVLEGGELRVEPFLDIRDEVGSAGLEQGLLGLALHPDFLDNGRFFVHYTDRAGDTRVAEYRAPGAGEAAKPEPEVELLHVPQPAGNHNGGMLGFGPDGYLYVALGDGGASDDRFDNGQRPETPLGTLLRLDVDGAVPYAIPPDNPFAAGDGGAPEVWAYGLRNPWRFWHDGGLLYIADVGQADIEEIDVAPAGAAGLNYGWPLFEGSECFGSDCTQDGLTFPAVEYDHAEGCSVIGGPVYRGAAIPEMAGHYFYGDWCGGWVRSFRYVDGSGLVVDERDWTDDLGRVGQILTFGVDGAGEMYVSTQAGELLRIIPRR